MRAFSCCILCIGITDNGDEDDNDNDDDDDGDDDDNDDDRVGWIFMFSMVV